MTRLVACDRKNWNIWECSGGKPRLQAASLRKNWGGLSCDVRYFPRPSQRAQRSASPRAAQRGIVLGRDVPTRPARATWLGRIGARAGRYRGSSFTGVECIGGFGRVSTNREEARKRRFSRGYPVGIGGACPCNRFNRTHARGDRIGKGLGRDKHEMFRFWGMRVVYVGRQFPCALCSDVTDIKQRSAPVLCITGSAVTD